MNMDDNDYDGDG